MSTEYIQCGNPAHPRARHVRRDDCTTSHLELELLAEFDHPFVVDERGRVTDALDVFAPEVYHVEHVPGVELEIHGDWEALTDFSGQDRYHGPVMHSSEFVGGGLADYILTHPGTYVTCVVTVLPEDNDGIEGDVAGWVVLRQGTED